MDLLVWQLADSAFPSGGFAHSGGLEAAAHHGEVNGEDALVQFGTKVIGQVGRSSLPLVTAAHAIPGDVAELDSFCEAFLSNPVANRASCAQGRAFLIACARSFPDSRMQQLCSNVGGASLHFHYAPIFGAVMQALEVDRQRTQRLFLFLAGRTVVSAAVRLGAIGPYEAQRLQRKLQPEIERTLERCAGLRPLDVAQSAPLLDLFQSTHDRLYSRLFQS